jgi:hypothetical protein
MAVTKDDVLRVPLGTASDPISKFFYRLRAPLRWWVDSSIRKVADEIRSLPPRISMCLRTPCPRNGFRVPLLHLEGSIAETWRLESRFLRSCSEDMQRLSKEHRWTTHLDREMAAQAYLAGATWAIRNICNGADSGQS